MIDILCNYVFNNNGPYLSFEAYYEIYSEAMMSRFSLFSLCMVCCAAVMPRGRGLQLVQQWREMQFVFPDEETQTRATEASHYLPGQSVPIDVDVHYGKDAAYRIFVSIPRFDVGRPITLGVMEKDGRLRGYPSYTWHENQGHNCDGLTSVFRVSIDCCNRLWVLDTGKINDKQHCAPQILAFDLDSDLLLYRHRFTGESVRETSLHVTPVVDVRKKGDDCHDTFVYVADVTGFGLVVVDVAQDRSWRISHRLFWPFPDKASFSIDGEGFDLMDGVLGMSLSPSDKKRDRILYFHSLASTTENFVKTSLLRNSSFIEHSDADPDSIKVLPAERPSQSAAEAIDKRGVMYFGLMDPPSVWCWNTATEYHPSNFHALEINQETLQFASGVKVVVNAKGIEELWVLTCSFQRVMTGSLDNSRVNFRIVAGTIDELLANSPCMKTPTGRKHGHHANQIMPGAPKRRISSRYGAFGSL